MKKTLAALRGVVGVNGVIIWDKISSEFHKLLPARMDSETSERISALFSAYCVNNQRNSKAILRFERGWLFIYNFDQFAVLAIGREDCSKVTLNLVLKSVFNSIRASIKCNDESSHTAHKLTTEQVAMLTRAINLSVGFFQSQVSRFRLAELLREARALNVEHFPILKSFTIDANGGVIVIRGAEENMDSTAVVACARLLSDFVSVASEELNIVGFDVEKQTQELGEDLFRLGFYQALSQATGFEKTKRGAI